MRAVLQRFSTSLFVGRRRSYKNLTIYPLLTKSPPNFSYLVLDEALQSKHVEITEVDDRGNVPELKISNRGGEHVLIVDGEELLGAKQNRIVNASFLIPPQREVHVPVSCVEQGRWQYNSSQFTTSQIIYTARARRQKCKSTTLSLRIKNSFATDQGQIWDTVSSYLTGSGTPSQTMAFNDFYKRRQHEVERYATFYAPQQDQVGHLVYINDRFAVMDSFSQPATLRKVFPKLMRSYALDAIDKSDEFAIFVPVDEPNAAAPQVPRSRWAKLLGISPRVMLGGAPLKRRGPVEHALGDLSVQQFDSIGESQDIRFENRHLMGSALVHQDHVLHMNFFPN